MVTDAPTTPDVGFKLVMLGAGVVTVNATPLLATPPTVTTTFPVVAPAGTAATMLVALQLAGVAAVPLKLTVLVPCAAPKLEPLMVTDAPINPNAGFKLVMLREVPPLLAARNAANCMIHGPEDEIGAVALYEPVAVTSWSSRMSPSGLVITRFV
jgi:hypothetical protein